MGALFDGSSNTLQLFQVALYLFGDNLNKVVFVEKHNKDERTKDIYG